MTKREINHGRESEGKDGGKHRGEKEERRETEGLV